MKRKTLIIISAIILAAAIVTFYFIYKNKHTTYTWKTTPVKKGDVIIMVKSTGTLNADTTVNVGAQVTGIIWKLYADWNSVVKKGDVIAILDTTFLSASRIDAQASLEKAQAQFAQAQRDFDRNKKLLDEKVVAETDYETTLTALALAKASVTSAKSELNHALINLQYAVIHAPVSGTVISRSVELGQTVVSSMSAPTLFTIANDLTRMQVQANVDEADVGQIKVGQKTTFTVDAYPEETFTGEIALVRINPVMVQNVVNYIVIVNVANPDLKLLPGLTANIGIHVQEHDSVLMVPVNALSFTPPADFITKMTNIPDSVKTRLLKKVSTSQVSTESSDGTAKQTKQHKGAYVWIKKGEELFPKKVKIGLSDGNFTEVSGDIKEGDEVVTGQTAGTATSVTPAAKSPFMPQMPGGRGK
jgi:HlyD family secretion protein